MYKISAILVFLLFLPRPSSPHNHTQSISIQDSGGCTFQVSTSPNTFNFYSCSLPNGSTLTAWADCLQNCCPNQMSYSNASPSFNILNNCKKKSAELQGIGMTTIIIFAIIVAIAVTICLCFFGIIFKLVKTYAKNRITQEIESNLPIEWENEQPNLTTSPLEIKWCKKPNGKSNFKTDDSTCCICLEQLSTSKLYCNHVYHPTCISQWLKKSSFCPMCHREDIRSVKIYCKSCLSQYYIVRRGFIILSKGVISDECVRCKEEVKEGKMEMEIEINNINQELIFQFSSEHFVYPE